MLALEPEVARKINLLVANLNNLPTPPVVFSRINDAISNPRLSAYHIASIIAEDPAMSAKVLRLSNSAYYGSRRKVDSVKQAIVTVGLEAVRNLVLSSSIIDTFKLPPMFAQFQDEYWRHSLAAGSTCRVLTRLLSNRWIQDLDRVFSAGLLHDIGKLVMITCLPREWERVHSTKLEFVSDDVEVEERTLGYTHAEVGAILADKWNIPEVLTDAIAFHHKPLCSELQGSCALIVYCANQLAKWAFAEEETAARHLDRIDPAVLMVLNLTVEDLVSLKTPLIEEYAKSEVFLHISQEL